MHTELTSPSARWWYALKPASWPKLFVPAVFGQALGAVAAHRLSLDGVVFGMLWTIAHVAFVVLINDWADRDVDAVKRRMFPGGGGPKTIPDRILPANALLVAGVVAGVAALLLAALAAGPLARPLLPSLAIVASVTFVAYSLPPVKLNSRGGGELLEAFGVGLVMPVMHHYVQAGSLSSSTLLVLLPCVVVLALASAIASGLADEVSDGIGGKRTFVTTFGNPAARASVECLVGLACVWLAATFLVFGRSHTALILPGLGVMLVFFVRLVRVSRRAGTNAFEGQRRYKRELHGAVWLGTTLLALGTVANALLPDGAP